MGGVRCSTPFLEPAAHTPPSKNNMVHASRAEGQRFLVGRKANDVWLRGTEGPKVSGFCGFLGVFWGFSGCFWVFLGVSGCFRVFQGVSVCFSVFQSVSGCFKVQAFATWAKRHLGQKKYQNTNVT